MIDRPRFKAWYRPVIVQDEGVLLLADDHYAVLEGNLAVRLSSLMDGHRTVDQIVDSLRDVASDVMVHHALESMERGGLLSDGVPVHTSDATLFWEQMGLEPETIDQ